MALGKFLYFPLNGQAFEALGAADVLTYQTDTDFDLLSPSTQSLQYAIYHPDDVWSISDTITRGGDTVGQVFNTGTIGGVFVAIIDVDFSLPSPITNGQTLTNGTTAQIVSNTEIGVKVGGTTTNYWTTRVSNQPVWTPVGDHSLIIPNAMAAPFFGIAGRSTDMGMIWRSQYRGFATPSTQFMLDFGARKTGSDTGGYAYQPNVTNSKVRCQISYSALDSGNAGFLIGSQANDIDLTGLPETVQCSYQLGSTIARVNMATLTTEPPVGAYFDSGNNYEAIDLPLPLCGSQHGYDLRIFGRSENAGTGYVDALGNGSNDYSIRDVAFFFPESYASSEVKNVAVALATYPTITIDDILSGKFSV